MPATVNKLIKIREDELLEKIQSFKDIDEADIVTAYADGKGTFTVESTVIIADQPAELSGTVFVRAGKMSTFGGPDDTGVKPDEGLALFSAADVAANPDIFLTEQPADTTGEARRLNPEAFYIACRWDYAATPKHFLRTIKVRVAKAKSSVFAEARPVDFGPAVATGRVADLSPGLAKFLKLKTDDECRVEMSPPQIGVAVGVDLQAIDKVVFPPDMTRSLVAMTTMNNSTYWITGQLGAVEGGQSLMRKVGLSAPEIILTNTTVFPVIISDLVPALVADELNKASPKDRVSPKESPVSGIAANASTNAKIFAQAKAFVGFETKDVPGTDHGNLACAWAINEVIRVALGKAITRDSRGKNGLGTGEMFDVLRERHRQLDAPVPGCIVISPTPPRGNVHGHVGIVGEAAGGDPETTQIFSNSSSARKFAQNRTIRTWKERYVNQLHLQLLYFEIVPEHQ